MQDLTPKPRTGDADELVFELSTADVVYLLSQPGFGVSPYLVLNGYVIKTSDAPDDAQWGYAFKIEQDGQAVSGTLKDSTSIDLDGEGYTRSAMRSFPEDSSFSALSGHLAFKAKSEMIVPSQELIDCL
jgi:hypothetical protein